MPVCLGEHEAGVRGSLHPTLELGWQDLPSEFSRAGIPSLWLSLDFRQHTLSWSEVLHFVSHPCLSTPVPPTPMPPFLQASSLQLPVASMRLPA